MSNSFVQHGNVMTQTPAVDVAAGAVHFFADGLFGVALNDVSANKAGAFGTVGVWDIAKASGIEIAAGESVYWDATAKRATNVSGNYIGIATASAVALASAVTVKLAPSGNFVSSKTDLVTGVVEKAMASGRDMMADLGISKSDGALFRRDGSGGTVAFEWADCALGAPTSGWTVAVDPTVTYGGHSTLKLTSNTASRLTTMAITLPNIPYFGPASSTITGAKKLIGFAIKTGDKAEGGEKGSPVQLWLNYGAGNNHRLISYVDDNTAEGDWSTGFAFNQDAAGVGQIAPGSTVVWAKIDAGTEGTTTLYLDCTPLAAVTQGIWISPILLDPVAPATISLFMDGQYSGQYNYARKILQAYGLRASMSILPYWLTDNGGGPHTGTMTLAQMLSMRDMGHEAIAHTGAQGPAGHLDVGWNDTVKYPDGAGLSGLIAADQLAVQTFLTANNWTKGIGYGVVSFTAGLGYSGQSLARRQAIAAGLRAAGMKKIRESGTDFATASTAGISTTYEHEAGQLVTRKGRQYAPTDSAANITAEIDRIILRGGWRGFTFHDFVLSGAAGTQCNVAIFDEACRYLRTKIDAGVLRVVPFSEAFTDSVLPRPVF